MQAEQRDALFVQLDRQRVGAGPESWIAEVYGVHVQRDEAWVQIGPAGNPDSSVVLHLSGRSAMNHALGALAAWSSGLLANRFGVIEVMHVA